MDREIKEIINSTENPEKAENLFLKIKDNQVKAFLVDLINSFSDKMEKKKAVKKEFKYWLIAQESCCIYLRPFSNRIDVYVEKLNESEIQKKTSEMGLLLETRPDHNPLDQFEAAISIDGEWLRNYSERTGDLIVFINKLIGITRVQNDNLTKIKTTIVETIPLNQILYGPPGTGKTYDTRRIAVKIIGS